MRTLWFIIAVNVLMFGCLVLAEIAEDYGISRWGEGDRELPWSGDK